jgi:ankyrin repeat protein
MLHGVQTKSDFLKSSNLVVRANKDTLWHICAEFDQEQIMEYLTTIIDDFNINCQNTAGETALMVAAREGNLAIIKYMCEKFI